MVVVNVRELQPDHPKAFVTFLRERPHTKDPSVVKFLSRNRIITGGSDKKIFLWLLDGQEILREHVIPLYSHSGQVTDLHVGSDGNLYSTCTARYLQKYSLVQEKIVESWLFEERLLTIKENPRASDLLLVGLSGNSSQLRLFDVREKRQVISPTSTT
eukprot:TRINITY_DN2920_c0_g1_i3.p1 TRINITY_DN2920_c0_g1~~TRINITY_DN2920_c0_g1_i3.p1  ORF type:complete len:158 (-),score=30.48 TRINITY_DN2920_c0_g1_i3:425-898(-)